MKPFWQLYLFYQFLFYLPITLQGSPFPFSILSSFQLSYLARKVDPCPLFFNNFLSIYSSVYLFFICHLRGFCSICSLERLRLILNKTSYYSFARPAQPGPNRTWLCGPCIAAIAGDYVRFGPIRQLNLFRYFSVNVLPSWLRNADQWKPDCRVVTNEKPRN